MSTEEKNVPDNLVAKSGIFGGMNVTMGVASMAMILGFVFFTIRDVEYSSAIFSSGKDFIIGTMGWFYVVVVNVALFFVFWLLFSRFGDVKLIQRNAPLVQALTVFQAMQQDALYCIAKQNKAKLPHRCVQNL